MSSSSHHLYHLYIIFIIIIIKSSFWRRISVEESGRIPPHWLPLSLPTPLDIPHHSMDCPLQLDSYSTFSYLSPTFSYFSSTFSFFSSTFSSFCFSFFSIPFYSSIASTAPLLIFTVFSSPLPSPPSPPSPLSPPPPLFWIQYCGFEVMCILCVAL